MWLNIYKKNSTHNRISQRIRGEFVIKLNNHELDRSIDDVHKVVVEAEVKAGYKIANDCATDTDLSSKRSVG